MGKRGTARLLGDGRRGRRRWVGGSPRGFRCWAWFEGFEVGGVFTEAEDIGFQLLCEVLDSADVVSDVLLIAIAIDIITIGDDGFEELIDADVFVEVVEFQVLDAEVSFVVGEPNVWIEIVSNLLRDGLD